MSQQHSNPSDQSRPDASRVEGSQNRAGPRWEDGDEKPIVGTLGPRGAGSGEAEGTTQTGLERNRGPGRRRSEFMKSAEEGEMNGEQFLFVKAIDAFKRANDRMYPTWTDVLEVVRLLGYRKTMPSELNLRGAEDFREAADAKANVRRPKREEADRQRRKAA